MARSLSLGLVVFALWLALSGFFEPLLLFFGIASSLLVVLIGRRMDVVDHEGAPLKLSFRAIVHLWPWLFKEIIKANIDVAKIIIDPKLPISPCVIRVHASQKSEVGKVIYANSITLTPGTLTTRMDGAVLEVHAITKESAASLQTGEMDERVGRIERDY